jgi:hypothetical protein
MCCTDQKYMFKVIDARRAMYNTRYSLPLGCSAANFVSLSRSVSFCSSLDSGCRLLVFIVNSLRVLWDIVEEEMVHVRSKFVSEGEVLDTLPAALLLSIPPRSIK